MMLLNENENSWVSKVKTILFYCNVQETWQTQTVGNEHQFIEVLKEKLIYFSYQNGLKQYKGVEDIMIPTNHLNLFVIKKYTSVL